MKAFRAYLADNDEEHTYYVRSTRNIHNPDVMDQVRQALLGWELRDLETDGYKLSTDDNGFPMDPLAGYIWSLKATLGLEPPDNEVAVQKVAFYTNINHNYLMVHRNDEPAKKIDNSDADVSPDAEYRSLAHGAKNWDATPDKEAIDPDAQNLVGEKGLGEFLKILDQERRAREEERKTHEVEPQLTESFVTSHMALKDVLGPTKKGFYLVERHQRDPNIMEICGPLRTQPVNYEFVADLDRSGAGDFEVLSENRVKLVNPDSDFRFTNRGAVTEEDMKYEVVVTDQDTGRDYPVVVTAESDTDARDHAVQVVADKEQIDPSRLIAVEPHAIR
jgi:hypothetical protein